MTKTTGPARVRAGHSTLSSVSAAMRVLKAFSSEDRELGTTVLAERLGLSKSTIHRLAASLKAEGFLEQDTDTRKYRLGLQFFSVGAYARRQEELPRVARPLLLHLRDASREACALVVLDGDHTVVLASVESPYAVQMAYRDGERKLARHTCAGRMLYAHAQESKVLSLEQVLSEQYGVKLDEEGDSPGMRSMTVPILGTAGHMVAAITVAGPASRLSKKAADQLKPVLLEASRALSLKIGAR